MLPALNNPMRQSGTLRQASPLSEVIDKAPSILEFHRVITIQAAHLGLLARNLRQEIARCEDHIELSKEAHFRQQRIHDFRNRLSLIWNTNLTAFKALGYTNDCVPIKDRGIFEHVSQYTFLYIFWNSLLNANGNPVNLRTLILQDHTLFPLLDYDI